MPEVVFDIKVSDAQWSRKATVKSVKGAWMLCTYSERLFEIVGIPASFAVRETEAQE